MARAQARLGLEVLCSTVDASRIWIVAQPRICSHVFEGVAEDPNPPPGIERPARRTGPHFFLEVIEPRTCLATPLWSKVTLTTISRQPACAVLADVAHEEPAAG